MRISALFLSIVLAGCASAGPPSPPVSPHGPEPAPEPPPPLEEGADYVVFRGDGSSATLADVVAAADDADVVFFGEQHDDPVTHRLQALLLGRLYTTYQRPSEGGPSVHPATPGVDTPASRGNRTVVLSLEMFERDVQRVVDEYLADLITEDHFLASSRPWDGYETRYRPLVEFAKAHGLDVVAANAPRRYVNRASRLGRASLGELSPEARAWLPPLPYPEGSTRYRAQWDSLMGPAAAHMRGSPFDGQTLWDASMGQKVAEAVAAHPDALVLHLAGSFHVASFTGTPEALEHYRPGTRALVVVAVPAEERGTLGDDRVGLGDFVVLTRPPDGGE
jgi:uncharacterized iron-regulated protein